MGDINTEVVIIGAGVTGCAVARELSKYKVNVVVVDKEEDVCCGTSKANSGIVHAGFDCKPGSLMAKMNVEGNRMLKELSKQLDFPLIENGSLVLCFSEDERKALNDLYEQGIKNGVPDIRIIEKNELRELEPSVSEEAVAALYAPTGAIVCPFNLNIALAENAFENGVDFKLNTKVEQIEKTENGYILHTDKGDVKASCVVNAAGVYADTFHNMVSDKKIHITARKGEYILLDKSAGNIVKSTIFQLPGKYGKGVLVTPTVHGNLLVGPTAADQKDKESTNTTADGLDEVMSKSGRSVKALPMRSAITSFAGLRAHEDRHEFIVEEAEDAPYFFDCAGIESPGLTSCAAIGKRMAEMVADRLELVSDPGFIAERKGILRPSELSEDEYNKLIQKEPAYGNIVCRCERVTEGEIIDAIKRPLGAKSLDGVKRRTRAGMGRCQAGFCSPRTMEIIARELNEDMSKICKSGTGSEIIR